MVAVKGSGLVQGALVTVDGKGVPTQFVSAGQVSGTLPAAKLVGEGTLQIAAVNPAPGGGASNALPFAVTAAPIGGDAVVGDAEDAGSTGDGEVVGDTTDASADATPACVPKPEVCDGQDNDCNGQTDEASCDDGDVCTTADACVNAKCAGKAKDCADTDACTVDSCNGADGKCENVAFEGCGLPCAATSDCKEDANPCAVAACQAGKCAVLIGKAACNDNNLCTDDACDSKSGCANTANTASCTDGKVCMQGDSCANKACAPGKVSLCDDGNSCTLDTCSEASGCSYQATSGACDDGDGCTVGETCADGGCKGAVAKNCDDGKPCTVDSCDPSNGNCAADPVAGCGDACKVAGDCKDDGNPCTQATCVADACGVTPTTATCDDGDPCTAADGCAAGVCAGAVDACDDGNSCTADSCGTDGKCSTANQAGECNDGDACTIFDACAVGVCKAGAAANCDDGNACTDDSCAAKLGCQHADSKTPCSDSNPCTVGDACKDAACKPTGPKDCSDGDNCTLDACDAVDGSCDVTLLEGCGGFCNTPKDCKDDGNPCTDWACPTGKCEVSYNSQPCDDKDACSEKDTCDKGKCGGATVNCDDKNVCSDDSCDIGTGCVHLANASTCTDGAVCTVADVCKDQACQTGPVANCDDLNACTFDTCLADKGCVHTTGGQACSDGNPCTQGDACVGANCVGGTAKSCDDSNGCTADSCSVVSGACVYAKVPGCGAGCVADKDCVGGLVPCLPLSCMSGVCAAVESTATCDDGSVCTTGDGCSGGACAGKAKDCNDANGCTADSCDAKKGCQYSELSGACEDGDLCSVMDQCQAGLCKGGPVQQCDDGNPCTVDGCDAKAGCQFADGAGGCDDANPCTTGDQCAKGACLPGAASPCDDGNGCTADSCDPKTAKCGHADVAGCGAACAADSDCKDDNNPCTASVCANGACSLAATASACDDGNPCTSGDSCKASLCLGTSAVCQDGNLCTDDSCDPKTGCVFAANKAPCASGNACLTGEACNAKACGGGQAVNCNDGNSCTLDQCNPKAGCQYTATNAPCDDGSPCSIEDECGDGVCLGGTYLPCDDGDGCTADTCDTAKGGCVFTPLVGCGKLCAANKDCPADDSPCTEPVCAAGVCVVAFVDQPCNDGDACSSGDLCNGGVCGGTENACDDGNPCTTDLCLGAGKGCSHALAKGPCDDGSACTTGDVCTVGICKGQGVLTCDDGNPCSADKCDPNLGCTHAASKGACDDGNLCTQGDTCANFGCVPGAVLGCDDGKPCTFDACEPATGKCKSSDVVGCGSNCEASADCAATGLACAALACEGGACKLAASATLCDDANACTTGDSCAKGLCVGAPKGCDDDNSCTLDSCVAKTGCAHSPASGPCDDGNACTSGEGCSEGACAAGKAIACGDANPCTDDSCKPTEGCVYLANDVTCDDGNVCTVGDACAGQYCTGDEEKDCSDGNPCTLDGCATAKGCIHAPSEAACNDGDACTKGDVCLQNQCTAGKPVNCDDSETCTDDSCDKKTGCVYTPKPGDCSDSDPCTVGDVCLFGNCVPGQNKDCSDGNGCTADSCNVSLGCVHTDTTAACDDGDACTDGDVCAKGACIPGKVLACNDDNACTDDSCDKVGGCKNVANQAACSDGNACTADDNCKQGVCTAGSAIDCNDNNPCTAEKCDPQKGCALLPLAITCTDDSACTTTDTCMDGDCIPGPKLDCNDGKVCTDDSCDKVKGCVQLNNTATCTDDSVCTTNDGCADGACLPGAATNCDDKNPCTDDTCDKVNGCANVQSTKPCSDGDACTNKDTCANGKCVAVAVNCDDGNACTSESCDPVKGCANEAIDVVCSDGDACTAIDKCVNLQCVSGTPVDCDDKNVCTNDSCDKAKGCVNAANNKACDDGTVCTSSDACAGGKCGGTAVDCDDKKLCTDDSCDKVEGCVNLANTITCSDGDACTAADTCKDGSCLPGNPLDCDDKNACTDDSCDKVNGCQHANNTAACNDGDACTTADKCASGACGGTAASCDDSNACTDDACDKASGCKNTTNSATNCTDGNACTANDACDQGKCSGTPVTCNDNVACTVDACVPATGCKFTAHAALCNDSNACSTDTCDTVAGCKFANAADGTACVGTDTCAVNPTCKSGACSGTPAYYSTDVAGRTIYGLARTASGYAISAAGGPSWYLRLTDVNFNVVKEINLTSVAGMSTGQGARYVAVDGNGLIGVGGVIQPPSGNYGPGISVFDATGKLLWKKGFGEVAPYNAAFAIAGLPQGGFALTRDQANGASHSCVLDVFGTDGTQKYEKNLWGGDSRCYAVAPAPNGGVFVGGHTNAFAGTAHDIRWRIFDDQGNETKSGGAHPCGNDNVSGGAFMDATQGWFLSASCSSGDGSMAVKINSNGSYFGEVKDFIGSGYNGTDTAGLIIDGANNVWNASYVKVVATQKWNILLTRFNHNLVKQQQLLLSSPISTGQPGLLGTVDGLVVAPSGTDAGGSNISTIFKMSPSGAYGSKPNCPLYACSGVTCNDNVACTADSCHPTTGCVYLADNNLCDDGDLCTANACDAVKGCIFTASIAACDDKNLCTDDACDSIKGCTNTANTAPCEDGNACTVGDTCGGKACLAGSAKACEDGLACTSHSCDSKTGCKQTPNNSKCDDGKQCTADTCDVAKGCTYGPDTKLCDDANLCTDDLCDNAAGCSHVANAVLCNDGNACTTADACAGGACKGPKPVVCDDLKECTSDSCEPTSGCKFANKSSNTSCTPSTSCSATATCGGDGNCNDGLSKYYKSHLDSTKGGPWGPGSLSQVYDGSNSYMNLSHDSAGNYTGIIKRRNIYGHEQWTRTIAETQLHFIECSPWANFCYAGGRGGIPGRAHLSRIAASNGNSVAQFGSPAGSLDYDLGGNEAVFTDMAVVNGETQYPYLSAWRQSGGQGDAYVVYWGPEGKTSIKWSYEGPGDERATGFQLGTVVGYTNSKGGGGYDGFWDDPNNLTYKGTPFGGPGDEYFYGVMGFAGHSWAYGTGSDSQGGSRYVLLVRITGGVVVKKISSLNGNDQVGGVTDGLKVYIAAGSNIAAFNGSGDPLWQGSYPVQPLNNKWVAITTHSTGLLAGGTGYHSGNGTTGIAIMRSDWDGVTNCTDKNQCATLSAGQCDDKIACTYDSCDVAKGCLHTADQALCDDGNPCTVNICDEAKGCLFPLNNNQPCNDKNACTVDTCDSAAAKCIFKLDVAAACNDNNVCSIEYCTKATGCTYGSQSCEDNNPCTDESGGCDAKTGCSHVSLDSKPCDDGQFCTVEDFCVLGKCAGPNVCDLPANSNLVLHLDARVSKSLVMSGKKVATWYGVQAGQTQLTGAVVFGDFNTPEVVTQAINGKTAVDLTFAQLNVMWPAKDEWTAMAVFKNDKNPSGVANLMFAAPWSVNIFGVDCTLSYNKGVVSGVSSLTPTVPYGQPRIAVLRVTKAGAAMYVFGGLQAEKGSIPMEYAPLGSTNGLKLKTVTLGALQIYDKALSSAELAVAVADLKQDWGFVGKCKVDSDCNDADGCTHDTCHAVNGCQATPATTNTGNISCDDGNACSQSKDCKNGVCVAATTKDCNDNNPCTADSCNPYTGNCVYGTPVGSPKCDDGNACTEEYCTGGECKKSNKVCDDNNICTDDSCDTKSGCKATHNAAACDDGVLCTSSDKCVLGTCKGTPNTVPCDDFNQCTTADTCTNGSCAGKDVVCPDKDENVCTVETCSVFTGCKVTSIKACYDGKICTNDYCDPKVGTCVFTNNYNPCSDNELCTVGDFCAGGQCNSGKLNDCDDVDICTADKCVSNVGCSNTYSPKCEDGSLCTLDDLCAFGFCLGGGPPNCDDGNSCTNDFCQPDKGCGHTNIADGAACSDGVLCTQPDTCKAGGCVPGPTICDYAVTSLVDDTEGGLRAALSFAETKQQNESLFGGGSKLKTIRFFVGGKLTLKSPLPALNYNKVIEIGDETVIIDGANKYRALVTFANAVTIKGIKFQNCAVSVANDEALGYGLGGNGACIALRAGSGMLDWATLKLQDCSFYNGIAANGGGALYISSPWGKEAIVTMTGGNVVKNMGQAAASQKDANGKTVWSDGGGGVRVFGVGASFTATNVRFDYNLTAGIGGALWCGGGASCDVSQSSFYGGIAQDGAVAVSAGSKLTLTNVTISANEPGNGVSGLYSLGTTVLRHVTIAGNSALIGKNQTAAYFDGEATIVNSVFSESGSSAAELDCRKTPTAKLTVTNSLISVIKVSGSSMAAGTTCQPYGAKPAKLGSAKLEGNVRVMWPTSGSPVIDKADYDACKAAPVSLLDAMGTKRFKGNGCDIGAVEYSPLK